MRKRKTAKRKKTTRMKMRTMRMKMKAILKKTNNPNSRSKTGKLSRLSMQTPTFRPMRTVKYRLMILNYMNTSKCI